MTHDAETRVRVDELAKIAYTAHADEMRRQGYGAGATWPLLASDHAGRWYAVARAVLAASPGAAEAEAMREAAAKVAETSVRYVVDAGGFCLSCHKWTPHGNPNAEDHADDCVAEKKCHSSSPRIAAAIRALPLPTAPAVPAATGDRVAGQSLQDALVTILPMARGYAAEHPVGRNASMVEWAARRLEESWRAFPPDGREPVPPAPSPDGTDGAKGGV